MARGNKRLMVIPIVEYELDDNMQTATKHHSLYFEKDDRCTDLITLSGNEQMAAIYMLKQWRDYKYKGTAPEFACEFIERFLSPGWPATAMIHAAIRDGWDLQVGRPVAQAERQKVLAVAS